VKRLFLAAAALAAGCQSVPSEGPQALAELQPLGGGKASGTVRFYQFEEKVRVVAKVRGLAPGREHGFHIHEAGSCGQVQGPGAHFNPFGGRHGHFSSGNRHAGDLPALKADQRGASALEIDLDLITVSPGPGSIVGRSLAVHAGPDDYRSQPSGNSGAAIACAVIRLER
jgi:superoxide dismutase, Cu-Zn family